MRILWAVLWLVCMFLPGAVSAEAAPSVTAKSAVLMESESGRLLMEKEPDVRRPIASITKIMTALLAVESGLLKKRVQISEKARYTEGSSLYVEKGDTLTLHELVYGLMLRSGNDAAVAISEAVAGSEEAFVALMNKKAKALGMTNTSFMNPHGLDHPSHYSTARDMAVLMAAALKNDQFSAIASAPSFTTKSRPVRVWENKHRLVRNMGASGKTGFTKKSGRTLVTALKKNNMQLIAVTLNDPNDWADHDRLFQYGFATFQQVNVIGKAAFSVPGEPGLFHPSRSLSYPMTDKERQSAFMKITVRTKESAEATLWIDNKELAAVPLKRSDLHSPVHWKARIERWIPW